LNADLLRFPLLTLDNVAISAGRGDEINSAVGARAARLRDFEAAAHEVFADEQLEVLPRHVTERVICSHDFRDDLKIPKLGSSMPKMGIPTTPRRRARRESSLADALFSTTQQRVLGLLFGQPDRSFYATEIIGLAGAGSGTVQRELARLEQSGLVTVRRVGTQKHYQANADSPLFDELVGIARKTVGLAEPLRNALAPLAPRIDAAFVYGSVAKKQDTAVSDIDLLVVSDAVSYADLFGLLEPLTAILRRTVNPQVYTRQELAKRVREGNSFVTRILSQPKVWIYGSENELAP
jgi:predicted nucleotidyltransferase